MIKVSIMYPNGPETTFDVDYYKFAPTHDSRIFREALKGMEFNVGIGGRVPVNWLLMWQ
jgi:hypothetical protein